MSVALWPHMNCSSQGSLSMEFSRQESWSGSQSLLQGIFLTQGSQMGLLHCRWIIYYLSHREAHVFRIRLIVLLGKTSNLEADRWISPLRYHLLNQKAYSGLEGGKNLFFKIKKKLQVSQKSKLSKLLFRSTNYSLIFQARCHVASIVIYIINQETG